MIYVYRIFDAFRCNLLTINYDKTYYTSFSNSVSCPPFTGIFIRNWNDEKEIKGNQSVNYLGVVRYSLKMELSYKKNYVLLKGLLHNFMLLRETVYRSSTRTIYFVLVQSRVSYELLAWGAAVLFYLTIIQVAQKKSWKLCCSGQEQINYLLRQKYLVSNGSFV